MPRSSTAPGHMTASCGTRRIRASERCRIMQRSTKSSDPPDLAINDKSLDAPTSGSRHMRYGRRQVRHHHDAGRTPPGLKNRQQTKPFTLPPSLVPLWAPSARWRQIATIAISKRWVDEPASRHGRILPRCFFMDTYSVV
jgi:hypothetical protein